MKNPEQESKFNVVKSKIWNHIKSFIMLWPGTWAVFLPMLILLLSYPILLKINDKVGLLDPGLIQNIPFGIIQVIVINEFAFLGILFNFSIVFDWYKKGVFKSDWLTLSPKERWLIFLLIYCLLSISAVILISSLQ